VAEKAVFTQPRPFLLDYCTKRVVAQVIVHISCLGLYTLKELMAMSEFLSSGSGDMTFWGIVLCKNMDFDEAR
jgi:hypothetical protein